MTRREGDSNPTMSPDWRARRPRHRVAACVQCRAAGLSRLSCVTDFRIATAFYPCGGRPLTIGRVRLLAGCSTHRRAANIRGFIPGRITPGGHGSGIPPAAAPSFRGADMRERIVSGRPESNRPSVEKGPTQRACGRSSDRIQAPVGYRVIRHTARGRRPQNPAGRQPYFFTCHAM